MCSNSNRLGTYTRCLARLIDFDFGKKDFGGCFLGILVGNCSFVGFIFLNSKSNFRFNFK